MKIRTLSRGYSAEEKKKCGGNLLGNDDVRCGAEDRREELWEAERIV
jgi:hypothetical protein